MARAFVYNFCLLLFTSVHFGLLLYTSSLAFADRTINHLQLHSNRIAYSFWCFLFVSNDLHVDSSYEFLLLVRSLR